MYLFLNVFSHVIYLLYDIMLYVTRVDISFHSNIEFKSNAAATFGEHANSSEPLVKKNF